MEKKSSNQIWEYCVRKVNNSLNESDFDLFEKMNDSNELKTGLELAGKIRGKSTNSFLLQKIDKEKNWKYINDQTRIKTGVRRLWIEISKYAAIFILALVIGVFANQIISDSSSVSLNKLELDWGQMSKMTLSDGTQVWLNAGSILEYPSSFNKKSRNVFLNGEAQFKVAQNSKVPFFVKTKSGNIRVHGTTFNVAAYDEDPDFTVTLIEGKVSVENEDGDVLATLKPADQLKLNKIDGKCRLNEVNTDYYSNWIEGKILLDNAKLSEIAIKLQRWYNVDIQMNGDVGDLQISGTISKGKPLDLFLKILERMYGVKYEIHTNENKRDEIIISKNELPMKK